MKNYTLIDKAFLLKKTPMFSPLELDLLLPVADKLGTTSAEAGEVLFDLGDQAYAMYIITEGTLEIYDSEEKKISSLKSGDFFGDEAILSGKPRCYKAFCSSKCQFLTLSRTNLITIIHEYPKVAVNFLEIYAKIISFRTP